jgi:hypothetical protein
LKDPHAGEHAAAVYLFAATGKELKGEHIPDWLKGGLEAVKGFFELQLGKN